MAYTNNINKIKTLFFYIVLTCVNVGSTVLPSRKLVENVDFNF